MNSRVPFPLGLVVGWFFFTGGAVLADTPPQTHNPQGATDTPFETLDQVLGVPGFPTKSMHYLWKRNVHAAVFSLDAMSHDVDLFYVALPFDDLAHPDLAQKWVPKRWVWPTRPGEKPVSNCLGRWVEIKDENGDTAYARWEGVGPANSDDADYVFGTSEAKEKTGLAVSPAVARYFSIFISSFTSTKVSWRFVDDADVAPGDWAKCEEDAVIFRAIREADAAGRAEDQSPPPLTCSSREADYRAAYLHAYLSLSSAEHAKEKVHLAEARDGFIKVRDEMQSIARTAPRWESALLIARIEDIHAEIEELNTKLAAGGP